MKRFLFFYLLLVSPATAAPVSSYTPATQLNDSDVTYWYQAAAPHDRTESLLQLRTFFVEQGMLTSGSALNGANITNSTISTAKLSFSLATVATTGSYTDLVNLPTIPAAQVQSDWNASSGLGVILNKPTIPSAQVQSDWNAVSGLGVILNKPTIPAAQVQSDWNASSGLGVILNKPTIPAAQVNSDWNSASGLSQILNKPPITLGGPLTTSGAFSLTIGTTANTSVTMPTSGTLLTTTSGVAMLGSVNNFSANATTTGPSVLFSGAPVTSGGTGTTSYPVVSISTAGSAQPTTLSTSGTMFMINAPSGFAGNLMDLYVNNSEKFWVNANGGFTTGTSSTINGNATVNGVLTVSSNSYISLNGNVRFVASTNGILELLNGGATDFSRIQFGGTTNSAPALKRSTTGLITRMADDSADTWHEASNFNPTATQASVSGSTSGAALFDMPFAGSSFKMVHVHLAALNGTATWTYSTAFSNAPHEVDGRGLATSISNTAVTVTGTTTTDDITLVGY